MTNKPISGADAHARWEAEKEAKEEEQKPPMTPDQARAVMQRSAGIRVKISEQLENLADLDASVVSEVGTEVLLQVQPRRRDLKTRHCMRCGHALAVEFVERVIECDGNYWHKGKCT